MDNNVTGRLCRAARSLAGMTQAELARNANVAKQTIVNFESGARRPYPNNLEAIRRAFERVGIEFITEGGAGVGVRLCDPPR